MPSKCSVSYWCQERCLAVILHHKGKLPGAVYCRSEAGKPTLDPFSALCLIHRNKLLLSPTECNCEESLSFEQSKDFVLQSLCTYYSMALSTMELHFDVYFQLYQSSVYCTVIHTDILLFPFVFVSKKSVYISTSSSDPVCDLEVLNNIQLSYCLEKMLVICLVTDHEVDFLSLNIDDVLELDKEFEVVYKS
ncbi:hypothetical protein GEMRC1_002564 [Eukaryota sp. GEM-RC1]